MSTPFNTRVGENLKRYRDNSGLTQTELAERLSELGFAFQQPTILKVEHGKRGLRMDEALAVAEILHIEVSLLWGQGDELANAQAEHQAARRAYEIEAQRLNDAKRTYDHRLAGFIRAERRIRETNARLVALGGNDDLGVLYGAEITATNPEGDHDHGQH